MKLSVFAIKKLVQYNPTLRSLAHLDAEMESILAQQNIDVEEKLLRYQTALMRFGQLSKVQTTSTLMGTPRTVEPVVPAGHAADPVPTAAPAAAPPEIVNKVEALLMHAFPKKKDHIHEFSKYLLKFQDQIGDDEHGQVVLKGAPIEGSNYYDLLKALFQTRGAPDLNLKGQPEFINQLKAVGVNPKLVVNTTTKRALKGLGIQHNRHKAGAKRNYKFARVKAGRYGIPGIKPKVMRLY